MSLAAAIEVKGWCPGALRPMPSGDGLLARIKPWCGAFSLAQADGLADVAVRLGNGHIDLTRRANLQIRGLGEAAMPAVHQALDRLGLLDPDAETEAARNVMVGPLAGPEVRALASSLSRALALDRRLATLPAKFGWLVDDGGPLSIVGERADIALCVMEAGVALRVGGEWVGVTSPERATAVAITVALGRVSELAPIDRLPQAGARKVGVLPTAVGIAAPFGRLEATQIKGIVSLAARAGAPEIRLSPWRALYLETNDGQTLLDGARKLGLIVDEADPLLRIDACPGAPACMSASVDTRRDARRLATSGFTGTLHVSGCAKGCARTLPADLVLVGEYGRYGMIRHGTTRDAVERPIDAGHVEEALRE